MEPKQQPTSGIANGIAWALTVINVVSCGVALWLLGITLSGTGRTGRDELIGVMIVGFPACLCALVQVIASFGLVVAARIDRSLRWAVGISGLLTVVLQGVQMLALNQSCGG